MEPKGQQEPLQQRRKMLFQFQFLWTKRGMREQEMRYRGYMKEEGSTIVNGALANEDGTRKSQLEEGWSRDEGYRKFAWISALEHVYHEKQQLHCD